MIYFDNAATTMEKPEKVVEAVTRALTSMGNAGRGAHASSLDASRMIFDTRRKLAELFHGEDPSQVVFTANATESLNMAIKGLFTSKDHIITTQLEHNSVLRPLYELEEQGAELTILQSDAKGCIRYEEFEKHIKENTRAIVCTHGSNVTGNLVDIKKVGEIAKKHNLLFVVDASQTAGVFPIDVQEMNIDVLCFTGHKGLLGPQGTGGMYVRKGLEIRPLKTGGSGVQTYSRRHPDKMPIALEAGTLNAHGLAGLNAALDYLKETGIPFIREKEQELMWNFYEKVADIPGITLYGEFKNRKRCPIVSLNVKGYDSAEVSDFLAVEYSIATRPGAHCAPLMHQALGTVKQGAVRFSFSHYNTREEVELAAAALNSFER